MEIDVKLRCLGCGTENRYKVLPLVCLSCGKRGPFERVEEKA